MTEGGPSSPFDLRDHVVLVTGSSTGIGEAVARLADAHGASVVVNSVSSIETGEQVADGLRDAIYVQGDVSKTEDVDRLIEATIDRWGRLDHLVNNAGTTSVIPHHDFDALEPEIWRRILDVNVVGTFLMSRAALPHLSQRQDEGGGTITNITSIAGLRQVGSSIPYAVSKAGLNHLTRLMANQVGPGVRVNAVAPGLIMTPWTADWDDAHARVAESAPLKRSGVAHDVAVACLGLMVSTYATGQVLAVDGGLTLRG